MKEFLDSTPGRTLIIAVITAGVTIFASDWGNGAVDVLRSGGGAFFGALVPLVAYLRVNSRRNKEQPEDQPEPVLVEGRPIENPDYPLRYPQAFNEAPANENIVHRIPRPAPEPPPVDFDQPYHRSKEGIAHPGNYASECRWCADAEQA